MLRVIPTLDLVRAMCHVIWRHVVEEEAKARSASAHRKRRSCASQKPWLPQTGNNIHNHVLLKRLPA
jgi:hypothetical protein